MNEEELKNRTKQFSLRIIRLVGSLPGTPTGRAIGNQHLRCGPSVGANYRSACRGRSKPDFIAKAGIALEEADETLYWMELLAESRIILPEKLNALRKKAGELVPILTASIKTARLRNNYSNLKPAINLKSKISYFSPCAS